MVFYLLDGSAICYRAFYAYGIPDLHTSNGIPTKATYGVINCINKILKDHKPDGIIMTFDLEGDTFRHEMYDDYKANRDETPEELVTQFPWIRECVEAFNIPICEKEGFEADDVMGTLAKRFVEEGHEVVIVTSDKDACQLVGPKVKLLDPRKDYKFEGEGEVFDRFGVKPKQIIDYLALVGDSSDNVPGVPGIGKKAASQLLQDFKDVKGIYKNLDKIKGKAKVKNLEENSEQLKLSQELVTIDCDVPIKFKVDSFLVQEPNIEKLQELYKTLEFRSLLKNLPQSQNQKKVSKKYHRVTKKSEWKELLSKIKKQKSFSFDFETTSTNPLLADPVGVSFSWKDHEAYFVLFDLHSSKESNLKSKEVLGDLKAVFEDSEIKKFGQNIKYEMMLLAMFDIHLNGIGFDTMVASYLLNPSKSNHNLNDIAFEYLSEKLISIEELIGSGKKQITMAEADLEKLFDYGCQDSEVVWRLTKILGQKIKESDLEDLLQDIEIPLIYVLSDIEIKGISIDTAFLSKLSKEMDVSLKKMTSKIYKLAGEEFNIKSPKQLGVILFEKLKLPVIRKTKTGPSTDVDVLTQLSELHKLPESILHYRELSKLKSTYVDTMPEMLNPNTKRIHSSFNQAVTATGRLSSSDPNLQNIPIRTEEGRKIRKAFIASRGNMFLAADYSQIELRILAHLSGDENLKKAFQQGEDIHRYTASLIFGVKQDEVTPTMRDQAKTVNFGVLYGMSPFGLAKSLKISQEAARDFIDSYFDRYPKVRKYLDSTIKKAQKSGYVDTLFKRRRYIPDINSKDIRQKRFAERTAINAPVQGTASDLVKIAMVEVKKQLSSQYYHADLLIQVHDELVFEVKKDAINNLAAMVKEKMEQSIHLDVPIEVTLKSGPNWMELERFNLK